MKKKLYTYVENVHRRSITVQEIARYQMGLIEVIDYLSKFVLDIPDWSKAKRGP
jgi:hypothetical protein